MASRTFSGPPLSLERKVYEIHATFFPQGTSNPTFTAANCKGVASIVRNGGAGEWLITLQDCYKRLLSKYGSIQLASAADLNLQFATIANLGSSTNAPVTVLVRALAGATPTDISANANNSVSVTLVFSDADS